MDTFVLHRAHHVDYLKGVRRGRGMVMGEGEGDCDGDVVSVSVISADSTLDLKKQKSASDEQ